MSERDSLTDEERAVYDDVAQRVPWVPGHDQAAHDHVLASYARWWVIWQEAHGRVREFGLVVKGSDGLQVNAYLKVAQCAQRAVFACMDALLMTPASRARNGGGPLQ